MKKRRAPIVLVTVIGVLVAIATIMNSSAQNAAANAPMPEMPPAAASDAPRQTPDKETVAASMGQAVAAAEAPTQVVGGKPGMEAPETSGPLIARPEAPKPTKPTPNSSAVHGQWYSDQHAKEKATKSN